MLSLLALLAEAFALPACHPHPSGTAPRDILPATATDAEVLARLVHAEAISTGHPEDPLVHHGIAWGAMNRVRLAAVSATAARSYGVGVRGVVFKSGQFNPAVSTTSPFADLFLCPKDDAVWAISEAAAASALAGEGNPLIQTAWERERGLSLVVNFYYPQSVQARGPLAPWESGGQLTFIGDVPTTHGPIEAAKVRFYRLKSPFSDIRTAP
jgi:hypothetical protein